MTTHRNENLLRARLDKGLSQRDLSELTGGLVDQTTISRLEAGQSPRPRTRIALARALGVPHFDLFPLEVDQA